MNVISKFYKKYKISKEISELEYSSFLIEQHPLSYKLAISPDYFKDELSILKTYLDQNLEELVNKSRQDAINDISEKIGLLHKELKELDE